MCCPSDPASVPSAGALGAPVVTPRRLLSVLPLAACVAAVLSGGCSTTVRREPFAFQTASLGSPEAAVPGLAGPKAKCSPQVEKRLVYGLFVLPFNHIEHSEWDRFRGRTVRYREEVRLSDVLWSFIGIWVSIMTRTAVVEDCGPAPKTVSAERLALLEKSTSEAERLARENNELKQRFEESGAVRGRGSAGKTEPAAGTAGNGPQLPTLAVRTSGVRPLGAAEQFRFVMEFGVRSAELTAPSRDKLDEVVRQVLARKGSRVLVIGHVEFPGDESRKLRLAYDRAHAVAAYLTTHGVVGDRLLTASMRGAGWPHPANRTDKEHAMFLSVSVVLLAE